VYQFVGEQNEMKKTAARNIAESSQPRGFCLLYFQIILAVTVQETNR
jgi:uncharacterized membrane protein